MNGEWRGNAGEFIYSAGFPTIGYQRVARKMMRISVDIGIDLPLGDLVDKYEDIYLL